MRYAVYHAIDIMQMVQHDETQWQTNRQTYYRRVAEVEADSSNRPLSRVFERTNHHEGDWTDNSAVVWHDATRPLRSTSVGDVVVCEEAGQAWMVMPFGFKLLEGDTHAASLD